jgi:hypothetical protein
MINIERSEKEFTIFLSDGNSLQVFVSFTDIEEWERNEDEDWIDSRAEDITHQSYKWNSDGSEELELTSEDYKIIEKFIDQEAEDCFKSGIYEFSEKEDY